MRAERDTRDARNVNTPSARKVRLEETHTMHNIDKITDWE